MWQARQWCLHRTAGMLYVRSKDVMRAGTDWQVACLPASAAPDGALLHSCYTGRAPSRCEPSWAGWLGTAAEGSLSARAQGVNRSW